MINSGINNITTKKNFNILWQAVIEWSKYDKEAENTRQSILPMQAYGLTCYSAKPSYHIWVYENQKPL